MRCAHPPQHLHLSRPHSKQRRLQRLRTHSLVALVSFILVFAGILSSGVGASAVSLRAIFNLSEQALTSQKQTPAVHLNSRSSLRVSSESAELRFSNGRYLATAYRGESDLAPLLEQNQAQALSLATADFDEDGVPDLVAGYEAQAQGILTLHRGNIDSINPNSREAQLRQKSDTYTDAPFLSTALVMKSPVTPDFLGTGDFDANGHWDVVVGSRDSNHLYLLSGDGAGSFPMRREVLLPGALTALATGEVNRADGLTDVVVGVTATQGAQALIFEGPEGALRSKPEVFAVSGQINAIALGQLDQSYESDVVLAAGRELILVHGRDRKLSLDEQSRVGGVKGASLEARSFSSEIKAVAIGDFAGDQKSDVAALTADGLIQVLNLNSVREEKRKGRRGLTTVWQTELLTKGEQNEPLQLLSARVSSNLKDDLLISGAETNQIQIIACDELLRDNRSVMSESATIDSDFGTVAMLPLRLNADALSDLVILKSGLSAPAFVTTEALASFTVTNPNDSGAGSLREAILDANASSGADIITFSIGNGAQTINLLSALPAITGPVTIDATTQPGFSGAPLIELNGASVTGSASGLYINAGSSTVRGLIINRFQANNASHGIYITVGGSNRVEGNYIGTNALGTAAMGSGGNGVFVFNSSGNTIGGTTSSARNIISGNAFDGILISQSGSTGNLVQGNYIGTNVSANASVANTRNGIFISESASGNTVGGTVAGARNIISGNRINTVVSHVHGITMGFSATGNLVQGNYIGTDASGTTHLQNDNQGVYINASTNNTIGGTSNAARNLISGNGEEGVEISGTTGSASGNLIQGNYIGTNVNGVAALGNGRRVPHAGGIQVAQTTNTNIGGVVAGARNLISGNVGPGVILSHTSTQNFVQGNYIGTSVSGLAAVGNGTLGVFIADASNNTVGGVAAGASNLISGNGTIGVQLDRSTSNLVQGNLIGTNLNGTSPIANTAGGVYLYKSDGNTIGGTTAAARNVISGNTGEGVIIALSDTGNQVQGNYIGTTVSGAAPLGNGRAGVYIFNAHQNTVGGTTPGSRNLISSNGGDGVSIYGGHSNWGTARNARQNKIQANFIGVNLDGTAGLGNSGDGIRITDATENIIGGTANEARNIISSNTGNGIAIGIHLTGLTPSDGAELQPAGGSLQALPGSGGSGISIINNYIGTDVGGNAPLGNSQCGVYVDADSFTNTIEGNLIAFNGTNGVCIPNKQNPGVKNSIVDNLIFSNVGMGIDLGAPGDTPNDPGDTDDGANEQQNYPVLNSVTVSAISASSSDGTQNVIGDSFQASTQLVVGGTINSTPGTQFLINFYYGTTCGQNKQFTGKPIKLGFDIIFADSAGNATYSHKVTLPDNITSGFVNATATSSTGNTSEFSPCHPIGSQAHTLLQFSQTNYNGTEGTPSATVTVTRTGDTTDAATVNYKTSDTAALTACTTTSGAASERCDYATTLGTLRWAAGDAASKTFSIPIVDDVHVEGNETFTVTLSQAIGAIIGAQGTATVTLSDNSNDVAGAQNPIDNIPFLVTEQYLDFLGRLPDQTGFNNWTATIQGCPDGGFGLNHPTCDRVHLAKSTFQSIEFQTRGYWAYRFYEVAFGRRPNYSEFIPDMAQVGGSKSPQEEALSKDQYLTEFIQRGEFTQKYNSTLNNATAYVDLLLQTAGLPAHPLRSSLITQLQAGQKTRAQVLREIVESKEVEDRFYVRGFVSMMYYGFLRRDPDATGFQNYVNQLNQTWDPRKVTFDFLYAPEYRGRFGPN
jgi:hypothetical protein